MTVQRFERVTPRLPVSDLRRSIAFYCSELGFVLTTAWPDGDPEFAILERDATSVAFFVSDDPCRGSIGYAELYVQVSDVRGLHAALANQLTVEWGPEVYSYGRREFAIRDPDNYLVIFTEPTSDSPTTIEPT